MTAIAHAQRHVAVLYQATTPPAVDGVTKPLKPGGYSDSGADIAFALRRRGVDVVTPNPIPHPEAPFDWVWPDTSGGIESSLRAGATVLWANTVLFSGHPLDGPRAGVSVVGQHPEATQRADDKLLTNAMLRSHGLPVAPALVIAAADAQTTDELPLHALTQAALDMRGFPFPLVMKPIRGRGSQGVQMVETVEQLHSAAKAFFAATVSDTDHRPVYGSRLMLEEYLPGEELTVAVMPPGRYTIAGRQRRIARHWALPPVVRTHHRFGIAPYSGLEAITGNSTVLAPESAAARPVQQVLAACARAAELVQATATIRIDCRMARDGTYRIFDLNMKPNMTGPGRPGRDDQDSLVALAARAIGWSFEDLLIEMLAQVSPVEG